ncbi:MAG: CBS domain-containing protein [Melioribacteraceae bacterium]|nr:CBS domain-containing protein [Melioribacteraceae bacterium]
MVTAEDILNEKELGMISVPSTTLIKDALKTMVDKKIGSMLVKDSDNIIGIWTERDLMRNVIDEKCDLNSAKIGDYMTSTIKTAPHDATLYQLLDIFLGKRFRHILIEKDGSLIGLLSMGDVIKADLNNKTKELKSLKATVSWEYYENWRFKKK